MKGMGEGILIEAGEFGNDLNVFSSASLCEGVHVFPQMKARVLSWTHSM